MRDALEAAFALARRDSARRDAPPPPRGLIPVLRFNRLPDRALEEVRRALEADDRFRSRVLESLSGRDLDSMEPGARLFLERPEGWKASLGHMVEEASDAVDRSVALQREADSRRRAEHLTEALERIRTERDDAREDLSRLRASSEDTRRELEGLRSDLAELEAALAERSAERDEAVRQLGEARSLAERRLEETRELTERIEELRADLLPTGPAPDVPDASDIPGISGAVAALGDAAGAADALAASLRVLLSRLDVEGTGEPVGEVPESQPTAPPDRGREGPVAARAAAPRRRPVRLGRGLSADSVEGLEEYLGRPETFVIVDGYNVSMAGWPDATISQQRESLLRALGSVSAVAAADIHVVFDGAYSGGRPAVSTPLPVRVHFTEAGVEADDRILEFVDDAPLEDAIVVVSSDGRVRRGAQDRGAIPVSSSTLLARLRR